MIPTFIASNVGTGSVTLPGATLAGDWLAACAFRTLSSSQQPLHGGADRLVAPPGWTGSAVLDSGGGTSFSTPYDYVDSLILGRGATATDAGATLTIGLAPGDDGPLPVVLVAVYRQTFTDLFGARSFLGSTTNFPSDTQTTGPDSNFVIACAGASGGAVSVLSGGVSRAAAVGGDAGGIIADSGGDPAGIVLDSGVGAWTMFQYEMFFNSPPAASPPWIVGSVKFGG